MQSVVLKFQKHVRKHYEVTCNTSLQDRATAKTVCTYKGRRERTAGKEEDVRSIIRTNPHAWRRCSQWPCDRHQNETHEPCPPKWAMWPETCSQKHFEMSWSSGVYKWSQIYTAHSQRILETTQLISVFHWECCAKSPASVAQTSQTPISNSKNWLNMVTGLQKFA